MRKTLLLLFSLVPVPLVLASCQKKGEGEVCADDDECASGLTCDKHGRETGKCLEPHGHGGSGGADAGSADGSPPADAPAAVDAVAVDAAGATIDAATSAAPDGPPADRAPADTAPDASAPPGPDAAPDAAAGNPACEAYCTCMEQSCRTLVYPWADRAACLTACGRFSATERACFANFCTQASMMGMNAREHSCEHAAGALGAAECN